MAFNLPVAGDSLRRVGAYMEELKVTAQLDPNMTVVVNPGIGYSMGMNVIEYEGGTSPIIQAPSTGVKLTMISLNKNGTLVVSSGAEVTRNPELPEIPLGNIPLAAIYLKDTTTKITNDMITDLRGFLASGQYPGDHTLLSNREMINAHPISAITGLQDKLDNMPSFDDVNKLDEKITSFDNTTSPTITLNSAQTGCMCKVNAGIMVKRGDSSTVGIRYNESKPAWEFTNDGTTWNDMLANVDIDGMRDATSTSKGVVYMSTDTSNVAVATDDTRMAQIALKANRDDVFTKDEVTELVDNRAEKSDVYTKETVDNMLAAKMDTGDVYTKDEIDIRLRGKANADTVYSKDSVDLKLEEKADVESVYTKEETDAKLAEKYDKSETMSAEDIMAAIGPKANAEDVYTKDEINEHLNLIYTKSEADEAFETKENVAALLEGKANVVDVYDKAAANEKFALQSNVYEMSVVDAKVNALETAIATCAKADNVFTRQDINERLENRPTKNEVYTKDEVQALFQPYIKTIDAVDLFIDREELKGAVNLVKADIASVKSDLDNMQEVVDAKAVKADVDAAIAELATKEALEEYIKAVDANKAFVAGKMTTAKGEASIFNESDGGGAMYTNKNSNVKSFVGVNDDNGTAQGDICVQIYSKDVETNVGARLNVNPTGIYYKVSNSAAFTADDMIATKQDIKDALVLTSPNGTKYAITVADDGTLSAVAQ